MLILSTAPLGLMHEHNIYDSIIRLSFSFDFGIQQKQSVAIFIYATPVPDLTGFMKSDFWWPLMDEQGILSAWSRAVTDEHKILYSHDKEMYLS